MLHAEHRAYVPASAGDVFAFLLDGTNNARWRTGVLACERISTSDEVGTIYRQVLAGPRGRRIDADYRLTAVEPHRLISFEVIAGPVRPAGTFEVTPDVGGTSTVRFALECRPTGAMRLLRAVVRRQMAAEVRQVGNLFHIFARV